MRLALHVTLDRVTARRSQSGNLLVALTYTVVGQPDLPRLYDFYHVGHEVGWQLLARTAAALGVELGTETFDDTEACRVALDPAVGTVAVATVEPGGHGGRRFLSVLELQAQHDRVVTHREDET